MEAKSGNLSVRVIPLPKAGCMQTMVGFAVEDINWFALNKLKRGEKCSCPVLAHGSEATALAFSIYKAIQLVVAANPLKQEKSRTSSIDCGAQNGMFFITIQHQSTGTVLKKVLSLVESKLMPEALYKMYASHIDLMNGKPSREEFNYCVNKLRESLKHVTCVSVGKINISQAALDALVESAASKYKTADKLKPETKPESLAAEAGETSYPTVKAAGINAVLLANFLRSVLTESVAVNSGEVIVYKNNWKPSATLVAKVDHWVKFADKVNDLPAAFTYFAIMSGDTDPDTLHTFSSKKLTTSDIAKSVKASLA